MAEQQPFQQGGQVVRGIDYKTTFPFTMIFRSFRAAVHPSKLILALTAMILIYVGGNVLDTLWPAAAAVPGELVIYTESREQSDPRRAFNDAVSAARKKAEAKYRQMLDFAGKKDGDLGDLKAFVLKERERRIGDAHKSFDDAQKSANELYEKAPPEKKDEVAKTREQLISDARQERDVRTRRAYEEAADAYREAQSARGDGLFNHFVSWQVGQLNTIVTSVREGHWLGRGGVVDRIVGFFTIAPVWAMGHHPVFFTIFFLMFLSIWAVFGGAISRIAAVHIARDEKISIRQALRFSTAKFLSFLSAPIIPLIIVVAIGALVAVGGVLTNIPFLGPIAVGALFFLVLIAAFVMTLVVLGLAGGFNLMYPTIAVEGSDSFDAISRSFSYLYARPWRLAFYTLVAVVYGALCYTFIRYFLDLLLMLAHFFAGSFVFRSADNTNPLWYMMWPGPTVTQRLSYTPEYLSLTFGQSVGAWLIWMWVHLLAALLGAFAISFYFVANTVIYYLMRKEVDATELDDVYLEQSDEDFLETVPQAAVATTADTGAAPSPTPEPRGESPSAG